MKKREWKARTKHDLMIEVWEYLDCESVGAKELERIAEVVRERFGEGAADSPATVARLLADEGAELRHAEVLEIDVRWRSADPHEALFRNVSIPDRSGRGVVSVWRICGVSSRGRKTARVCGASARRS